MQLYRLPHAIVSADVLGMSVRLSQPPARQFTTKKVCIQVANRVVLEKQRC